MITFEVVKPDGFLGQKRISAGDTEKFRADFSGLLDAGVIITRAAVGVTSPSSTVSGTTLSDDQKALFWFVTATTTSEVFTLALQIGTNDGQTLNFTVIFEVAAPVVESNVLAPIPLIIGPTGPSGGPTGTTGPTGRTGPTGPSAGPTGPTGPTGVVNGANGSFTTADAKTVFVEDGLITLISG